MALFDGKIKIFNENEVNDNTLYDEPREITVTYKVNKVEMTKIVPELENPIKCVSSGDVINEYYTCYGRISGYITDISYEYSGNDIINLRFNIILKGAMGNGEPQILTRNTGFFASTWHTNYYGDNQIVWNRLESLLQYGMRFGFGYMAFPTNEGYAGQSASFTINLPLFESEEDCNDYIRTGDDNNAINSFTSEELNTVWFYDYRYSDVNPSNHSLLNTEQYKAEFKMKKTNNRVRFVKTDEKTAQLRFNCETVLLKTGSNYIETSVNELISDVILNTTINGKNGDLYTNIPIVGNFDDPIDSADNFTNEDEGNYTGEDSEMDNESLSGANSPLGCYYVSDNQFETIKNWIYQTDFDVIETIKNGLWQYGESPVQCIVDISYIPFSIEHYCVVWNKNLQFGSLVFDGNTEAIPHINLPCVKSSWGKVTHVNQRINPTYNDYRDYDTIKYSVYLPYYGVIELDNTCVGQNLRIVSYFNAWTCTLKYYVYVGNALVSSPFCDVGQHIALTGSDWIAKSKQNQQATGELINEGVSMGKQMKSQDIGGMLSTGISIIGSTEKMLEKPKTMVSGVNSGGINVYDDMNFYLIIENYETIKPLNLNIEYGTPCYNIGLLKSCSGFTVISDIKLNSLATDEEQNEIISLLKEGVII